MPSTVEKIVEDALVVFRSDVMERVRRLGEMRTPAACAAVELSVASSAREAGDRVFGAMLAAAVEDVAFQAETTLAAREALNVRGEEIREVTVALLGGSSVRLRAPYLRPGRHKVDKDGRTRPENGLYPVLSALGIAFFTTPATADEVCHELTAADSVRAARESLARRRLDFGHKQTLRIFNAFGSRAVTQREQALELGSASPTSSALAGMRVVVATDGGRIRERVEKKGRRRKNGHHGYHAPWREPRQLVIYCIDQDGKLSDAFVPVLDASMKTADEFMQMVQAYLRTLGVAQAREVIFAADGAKWIWDRVDDMVAALGIPPKRVFQVIDQCHAIQTLYEIADLRRWGQREKNCWIGKAVRALRKGLIGVVERLIQSLAVGRSAGKVLSHMDYFTRNTERMQYRKFKTRSIPSGSGAVESAVRRVINMRMKNNGTFWDEANAESMLMLRSYLKAGRWQNLVDWTIAQAADWWTHVTPCLPHVHDSTAQSAT